MSNIPETDDDVKAPEGGFFSLHAKDLKGKDFDFGTRQGKVTLVVNVASKCGFTPQYAGLEKLYQKYKDKDFQIIGFPCNQFGGQEPGDEAAIEQTCSMTYNVTFPIMKKIEVNGDNTHPVYQYLKSQKKQLGMSRIKWNFEKFLVGADGKVIDRWASTAKPESIGSYVEKALESAGKSTA